MGLNFSFYEYMRRISDQLLSSTEQSSSSILGNMGVFLKNGFCGAVAGGASKFLVYPLDTMKRRMQMQVLSNTLSEAMVMPRYKNAWHCLVSTFKNEGVGGFYKVSSAIECCHGFRDHLSLVQGIAPTVAKSVLASGITFAAYEVVDILNHLD